MQPERRKNSVDTTQATTNIIFRIAPEIKEDFTEICKSEGKSVSLVLIEFIKSYIKEHQE